MFYSEISQICTKEQAGDKHVTGKEVLTIDIEEAIADVTANHETFNTGQRMVWIAELISLSKRLDNMRSYGIEFDTILKVSIFTARAMLR